MKRVVCVCVFAVSLALSFGCGISKQSYLAKGNALFAAGKYQDASLIYRKAIQKDPAFGEAYFRLGLAALKLDQGKLAYDTLQHAVQLLPESQEAKERFADVCLTFYLASPSRPQVLYAQLVRISDELLLKNSNSYEGLMLKGYLAVTDRKLPEGIDLLERARRIDSSNPGVAAELVHALLVNGQVRKAEDLSSDLIKRNPSYGPIYDVLYDFYRNANLNAGAERILKQKVSNNNKSADYVLQLAGHYSRSRQIPEMQATLRRLLDDPQNFPQARMQVGDFYSGLRDYETALRYYQEGLDASPSAVVKLACQKRILAAYLGQGNNDAVIHLGAEVLKANPADLEVLHMHAGALLNSHNHEHADLAIRELRALVERSPVDASLLTQLGSAYRLKGDLNAARDQFAAAIKRQNDFFAARYQMAEIDLIQQRPNEAVQQAEKILELRPLDRRARLLRSGGWIALGDAASARADLARLIKEAPNDPEPHMQLGLLAIAERKYDDALATLGKYRQSADPRVSDGLAIAYLHQKQFDKAREVLDEGLRKTPDSPMLLRELADTEALTGQYDAAVDQLKKLLVQEPKSIHLLRRVAEVYELKGDRANEIAACRQACELAPGDLTAGLSLADALARAGRTDEARKEFARVVKAHPEDAPALNNAAFFLADSGGDLDEALRLAKHALQKIPNQPAFSDTVGYIYLKKGMNDNAVQTFSNLARKYPFAVFHYHLGLALYAKGDKTTARKELQSALSGNPTPEEKARIRELLNKLS
ncbi:MAG TPA: tetratricopeptide repeat protein [Bryobacteraceae bacterium]|nr:tetratricopeptide repeat protein [Bryobacteraceae bacterium]